MTDHLAEWMRPGTDIIKVGDPMTETWLDRFRTLMEAFSAAREAMQLADEMVTVGEGVGLRYYFYDFPIEHAKFEALMAKADITLKSDSPPPEDSAMTNTSPAVSGASKEDHG